MQQKVWTCKKTPKQNASILKAAQIQEALHQNSSTWWTAFTPASIGLSQVFISLSHCDLERRPRSFETVQKHLLLLLRSRLYLWGSPFWGEREGGWGRRRFFHMWLFFNPIIKVVTFHLRGWCMLGVFFVASIHLSRTWTPGSFESKWWNACVHRLDLSLYCHPKEF